MLQARILEAARALNVESLATAWGVSVYETHDRLEGLVDLTIRECAAVALMSDRPLSGYAR